MKAEYVARAAKNLIPWRLRYWLKVTEAKHPGLIPDIFKQKSDPEYYNNCFFTSLKELNLTDLTGRTICEMGPGQFLTHSFLAYQLGAEGSYLLEIADFAHQDGKVKINKHIILPEERGRIKKLPRPEQSDTWRKYLTAVNAVYYTNGINGYKAIPDNRVDYIFSYSVVEHIRKRQFVDTMKETYRFLRNGGVAYHTVDLMDHMGGHKNHLRFSEEEWEDDVHYRMDNYTNRLTYSELCGIWRETGFDVDVIRRVTKAVPDRRILSPEFRDMSEEDLATGSFVAVLRK